MVGRVFGPALFCCLIDGHVGISYGNTMPTLLIEDGFKFFFYANEHLPMHIHVARGDGYAKIDLVALDVVESCFKKPELKKVMNIVKLHRTDFVRCWHEYFNKR